MMAEFTESWKQQNKENWFSKLTSNGIADKATQKKLFQDAMYRLEHGSEDAAKMRSSAPSINKLAQRQAQHRDDYALNKLARQKFRVSVHNYSLVLTRLL